MNQCFRGLHLVVPVVLALAVLATGCPNRKGEMQPPELSSGFNVERESQLAPYKLDDLETIRGTVLHTTHFNSGTECGACHKETGQVDDKRMTDQCIECHSDSLVTNGKLQYHCTTCHNFNEKKSIHDRGSPPLELCLECHSTEQAGETIYGYYGMTMKSEMACMTCHQAHSEPQVFATDNCSVCHGEFLNNPLMKGGHTSCTICHQPHTWSVDPDTFDCTVCHSAPQNVIAHTLEIHPTQCTACHSPHFQDIKLEGGNCGICHENRQYTPGSNLPAEHNHCLNCHTTENWGFKGSTVCKSCHNEQREAIDSGLAPDNHTRCNSCHQPHTWRMSFNGCKRCHDIGKVNEHLVEFHPDDCSICHDPHFSFTPPASGQCSECHGDTIPGFQPHSPPMHMVCSNCHTEESVGTRDFVFAGHEETCMVCHAGPPELPQRSWNDVPEGHTYCLGCHQQHQWKPQAGEQTCGICHSDITDATAANPMHSDCSNCHTRGHAPEFIGVDQSCQVCHSDVAEIVAQFGKQDCFICHEQHSFKANLDNCIMCHGEPPGTHSAAGHKDCRVCHQTHTLKPFGAQFCTTCHTDRAEHFPGNECTACHTFTE